MTKATLANATPITTLILDGIWARPRRWDRLCRRIRENDGAAEVFHYDSSGRVRFEELGAQFAAEIRRRREPINIVAFSMGGIVARAAKLVDSTISINRSVFLNTPHEGSWLACALPFPGVRQMRPFDPFMSKLRDAPWKVPTLAVWTAIDFMVIPGSSAKWKNADESICCAVPIHVWPAWSGAIQTRIVRFLAARQGV